MLQPRILVDEGPLYLLVTFIVVGLTTALSTNGHLQYLEQLSPEETERIQSLWAQYHKQESLFNNKLQGRFPCDISLQSNPSPTSVHQLRPSDIQVVAAMGDSLTAGSGVDARNIVEVLIQYRGLSWSGGGQLKFEDHITLPNILKKHNAEVHGYATGSGTLSSPHSGFNVAVIGSTARDLEEQAKELVNRIKTDSSVDLHNDWKLVTILSGNNDICDFCHDSTGLNSKMFRQNVVKALDVLHAELPRTLVNLVEPLNVEMVRELSGGLLCAALHIYECDCAAFPASKEAHDALVREGNLMQIAVEEIALSGRYDTREDFTVVYQPFFNKTYVPRRAGGQPDLTFFAPDCFHFSRKGQSAAASALWNNMIEPVSEKGTSWDPDGGIKCPSPERPYIFTNKNSQQWKQRQNPSAASSHHGQQHQSGKEQKQDQQHQHQQQQQDAARPWWQRHAIVVIVAVVSGVAGVVVLAVYAMRRRARLRGYQFIAGSQDL